MIRASLALLVVAACGPGHFDRDRMDAIVARVRPLVHDRARSHVFRVNDALDPSSLEPADHELIGRGDGRGRIRAGLDAGGKLTVSIETRDDGHAGEWGYMFSDPGADTHEFPGVVLEDQHEERVADGWVSWHYDLD